MRGECDLALITRATNRGTVLLCDIANEVPVVRRPIFVWLVGVLANPSYLSDPAAGAMKQILALIWQLHCLVLTMFEIPCVVSRNSRCPDCCACPVRGLVVDCGDSFAPRAKFEDFSA